jgi:hypothetical protein
MSDSRKKKRQQQQELLDFPLLISLAVVVSVYLITYFTFSAIFGSVAGSGIATPLSTVSFFFISRWDRLRESKEISFQSIINLVTSISKTSIWNIVATNIFIFLIQAFIGFLLSSVTYIITRYINSIYKRSTGSDYGGEYSIDYLDYTEPMIVIGLLIGFPLSYILGGWLSAKLALRKNLPAYRHAILSCLIFVTLSNIFMAVVYFFEKNQLPPNPIFGIIFAFILAALGAKIAIGIKRKPKLVEDNFTKEEFIHETESNSNKNVQEELITKEIQIQK